MEVKEKMIGEDENLDDEDENCECWIIHGYGIDGICSYCLNKYYVKIKNE